MKHDYKKHIRRIVFILALLFCMGASAALAAGYAAYVDLNNVHLTAAHPYWKNGNLSGSENDWNAWFDTSTPTATLWLKDAFIDTLNYREELIYSDGDIVLALDGTNTLICPTGILDDPTCVIVYGDLIIRDGPANGTGSMDISLESGQETYDGAYGILTFTDLIIESGTIDILVNEATEVYGMFSDYGGVYIHGGDTKIEVVGNHIAGVSGESFNMTGGTIEAHTRGDYTLSSALEFVDALVTGGEGVFIAESNGFGGRWEQPEGGSFRVLGGRMVFASVNHEALKFSTAKTMIPEVNGSIWVSTDPTAAGKFLWDSSKGILAGNDVLDSEFRYVELEFIGVKPPVTGDASRLWLWLGIGLAVLVGGTCVLLILRRRQKSGAWFSYEDQRIGQGRENARQLLKDNPDIADKIDKIIRAEAMAELEHKEPESIEEELADADKQIAAEDPDLALLDDLE